MVTFNLTLALEITLVICKRLSTITFTLLLFLVFKLTRMSHLKTLSLICAVVLRGVFAIFLWFRMYLKRSKSSEIAKPSSLWLITSLSLVVCIIFHLVRSVLSNISCIVNIFLLFFIEFLWRLCLCSFGYHSLENLIRTCQSTTLFPCKFLQKLLHKVLNLLPWLLDDKPAYLNLIEMKLISSFFCL